MKWIYMALGIATGSILAIGNQVLINWLALVWAVFAVTKLSDYVFDRKEKRHV